MLRCKFRQLRRQHDPDCRGQGQTDGAGQLLIAPKHASLQVLAFPVNDLSAGGGFASGIGEDQIAAHAFDEFGAQCLFEVLDAPRHGGAIDLQSLCRPG